MNDRSAGLSLGTMARRLVLCLLLFGVPPWLFASADSGARARYIANMGAMIQRGETRVLFDPLFRNDFDTYDPVPSEIEAALLAGAEPWGGIDAVFISHYHEDHFDPETILALLRAHSSVELFAPEQAATAIRKLAGDSENPVLERMHGLSLANGEAAVDVELGSLLVEAVRIPHAGWPARNADVENLVYRVTLDSRTTVLHFGDADPVDGHFARQGPHWRERHTHFAMPPYWFFLSDEGREILNTRIGADHATGMHVPTDVPGNPERRPGKLKDVDLFTTPGETREIPVRN